jgi:recombination protein RecA
MGVKEGFVDKAGSWYAYKGDKIGQGKANACKFLEEHPDIANEIETAIRDKLMPKPEKKEAAKEKEKEEEANGELL